MKHYPTNFPNPKKYSKMIKTQQKIIDSLTAQNDRLIRKQDVLNNQTSQLHVRINELKNIIAKFTRYNTTYVSLIHALDTSESEYKTAKKDIYEIKKKYKHSLKHAIRRIGK